MSDIALKPVQELRATLTLSLDLARWVCAVEDGAALPETLPTPVIDEAKRQAALADRLMTPVPSTVLRPWLAMIAGHYGAAHRPKAEDQATVWARTVELAMEGMPAGVFTRANLGEVLLRNSFFPTAAQLMEVLAPDRDLLDRRARALRSIAMGNPRAPVLA